MQWRRFFKFYDATRELVGIIAKARGMQQGVPYHLQLIFCGDVAVARRNDTWLFWARDRSNFTDSLADHGRRGRWQSRITCISTEVGNTKIRDRQYQGGSVVLRGRLSV